MTKISKGLLFVFSTGISLIIVQFLQLEEAQAITKLKGSLEWRVCPADKPIKGNMSYSSKDKIYHKPTGAFYKRTNPEACFASSVEAEAEGFRASKR